MKKTNNKAENYRLRTISPARTKGWLQAENRLFPCTIGRSGLSVHKCEGDGATPAGCWHAVHIYYRADRIARPRSPLPVKIIHPDDGWCDAPMDPNYNKAVPLPYGASAENLWRADHAYDLVIVLDYNYSRRRINKGSAIFVHLSHDDNRPTAGCLAMNEHDLRQLLAQLTSKDRFCF